MATVLPRETAPPATPSSASIRGHPLHPMVVPFPIAFLVGAVATDLMFLFAGDPFWARVSLWLLGAGVIMGIAAALLGLIDFLGHARVRNLGVARLHFAGNAVVIALSAWNWWLRVGAPADVIAPAGVTLSIVVALLLVITGWLGGELAYRHRIGTIPAGSPP